MWLLYENEQEKNSQPIQKQCSTECLVYMEKNWAIVCIKLDLQYYIAYLDI